MADRCPDTIPSVVERAATRFADARSARRRTRAAHVRAAAPTRPATRRAALIAPGSSPATASRSGRRTSTEWVIAALGVYRAGAVVVPLNTRFKGDEAAYILDRAQAKLLFTVTDFLDTNYVDAARSAASRCRRSSRSSCCAAPPADGTVSRGPTSSPRGATASRAERRRARERALTGDTSPTSSSRRARPAGPRARCSRTARASRRTTRGRPSSGCGEGDRYLIVNPFFHTFGLKAGILACLITGATIVPHAVFDVDTVMQRVAEERISMLPGPPTDLPVDPRPPAGRPSSTCRRCGSRSPARRAVPVELDPAHARRSWASRRSSPATGSPRRPASRRCAATTTTPETIATTSGRAIPGVEVLVVDDDGNELAGRRAGRGRRARLQRHAGLRRRPRRHRGGDRRRRLAAHRRHRRAWTSAATCASPTA